MCGNSADVLTLNTQADNHAAQRLYERFGFQRTGDQQTVLGREIASMSVQERRYDAVVVGCRPERPGGGDHAGTRRHARCSSSKRRLRSAEVCAAAALTLPGFVHDVCSAIHPLGRVSPFFRDLPLAEHGLRWIDPPVACAHPFDDGTAALLQRSIEATGATLGPDAAAYRAWSPPSCGAGPKSSVTSSDRCTSHAIPIALALFGLQAVRSARGLARDTVSWRTGAGIVRGTGGARDPAARTSLDRCVWPYAWHVGASGRMAFPGRVVHSVSPMHWCHICKRSAAKIRTGVRVGSLADIPPARTILFDLTPRQLLSIVGERFPARLSRAVGTLSLWSWCVQSRLGSPWSGSLDGASLCRSRNCPSGRYVGRDCRVGTGDVARRNIVATVCAGSSAESVRPVTCSRWTTYAVGLLPCAARLE